MTASTIDKDIRHGTLSTYCYCYDEFPLRANHAYRTGSKVSHNCRYRCNSWAPSVLVAVGTAFLFVSAVLFFFVSVVLFLVDVAVVAAETARVAAGGSRPVALRGIAAPPDVARLLKARGLPVPNGFFAPIIGAVRAGLTLVLAPAVTSALAGALLRPRCWRLSWRCCLRDNCSCRTAAWLGTGVNVKVLMVEAPPVRHAASWRRARSTASLNEVTGFSPLCNSCRAGGKLCC